MAAISPGKRRRLRDNLEQAVRWRLDPLRLQKKFPFLENYPQMSLDIRQELLPYYHRYVAAVSTPDAAISLELAVFVTSLLRDRRPQRILDLGSGFSSAVFRYYQKKAVPPPEVWSIDDSSAWLEKTRAFLKAQGLPGERLAGWDEFSQQELQPFDFLFHDLGSITVRTQTLARVLSLAAPGGIVILDDMQKVPYGEYARKLLKQEKFHSFSLKFLRDQFHRYAFLAIR
jgi:predicted O-methyltransferase YrrM